MHSSWNTCPAHVSLRDRGRKGNPLTTIRSRDCTDLVQVVLFVEKRFHTYWTVYTVEPHGRNDGLASVCLKQEYKRIDERLKDEVAHLKQGFDAAHGRVRGQSRERSMWRLHTWDTVAWQEMR